MSTTTTHATDADCTVDPSTDTCTTCGVHHGDPCPACAGRGFHADGCTACFCPADLTPYRVDVTSGAHWASLTVLAEDEDEAKQIVLGHIECEGWAEDEARMAARSGVALRGGPYRVYRVEETDAAEQTVCLLDAGAEG